MTVLSSRKFNQQLNLAQKAANDGPVIITDRGKPAHVLMSFETYQRLTADHRKITDLLSMDDPCELELPVCRDLPRPADFV